MLAYTAREDAEVEKAILRNGLRTANETDAGFRVRQMNDADLDRILQLSSVVRWLADSRAFDLLRGVRGRPLGRGRYTRRCPGRHGRRRAAR